VGKISSHLPESLKNRSRELENCYYLNAPFPVILVARLARDILQLMPKLIISYNHKLLIDI